MQVINNLGKDVGDSLEELTITTNGSQLETKAEELYKAGVRRINVSLDHLDPIKFREITRWGDLEKVKNGLKKAREVGLKIKINTVAISEFNQYHLSEILKWCGDEGFDMTIIEVMPMGDIGGAVEGAMGAPGGPGDPGPGGPGGPGDPMGGPGDPGPGPGPDPK